MIRMRLSEAARALALDYPGADREFHGVSTDTRSLQRGNLFVALSGPHFDAHQFVDQAAAQGAAAALLSKETNSPLPALRVPDTRLALGQLAHAWRARFTLPVVAVTGSNGKTTVKEMIAAILQQEGATLVTQGNLNNDIGVPLTLFRLDDTQRFAVIEMGANHGGEIRYLTMLTRPDVAVITNAGAAHLEGFGSLEGVARAKGEIFEGLSAHGTAIVNADDHYAPLWRGLLAGRQVLSFGLEHKADISARWAAHAHGSTLYLHTPHGTVDIELRLAGRHNVMNALAAAAVSLAAGATLVAVKNGLEAMQAVKGRLQIKPGMHGARIIDDTYNANPDSLQAALQVLASYPSPKWLVLGDMGELGTNTRALHEQAGREAHAARIDRLFAVGTLSESASQAFGPQAQHFAVQEALIEALQNALSHAAPASVTLLVKGSRAARMEHVVAALTQQTSAEAH